GNGTGWSLSGTGSVVTATHPGGIAPGGSAGFDLTVDVGPAAVPAVTNSATVSCVEDPVPGNDRGTDAPTQVYLTTTLGIEKRASREDAEYADAVDYVVVVHNLGSSPVADLVVADVLPPGFAYERGT